MKSRDEVLLSLRIAAHDRRDCDHGCHHDGYTHWEPHNESTSEVTRWCTGQQDYCRVSELPQVTLLLAKSRLLTFAFCVGIVETFSVANQKGSRWQGHRVWLSYLLWDTAGKIGILPRIGVRIGGADFSRARDETNKNGFPVAG